MAVIAKLIGAPTGLLAAFRLTGLIAALLVVSSPAVQAQSGEKKDLVGRDALDAATQPLNDLNIMSREIPFMLRAAQIAPYDMTGMEDCQSIYSSLNQLDDVLGPDADEPPEKSGLANTALRAGGNVLGGLIPFRGVVRQLSGANAKAREWQAAIYAGVARRSFLKGFATARGCPSRETAALNNATECFGANPGYYGGSGNL